ncbi:hypothetical protein pb186bvf_002038 [Paramecium bursaria]
MLFASQDQYNPREVYQTNAMSYGAGVVKPQQKETFINNGVINTVPRTRAEREQFRDQEQYQSLVKQTPVREDMKAILHSPAPNTSLFQPDHERFGKDFASEEKRQREIQNKLKQINYEQRRLCGLEREGIIWQRNENAQQKDEMKRRYHEEQFNKGKRNANGLAYNPLTLEYAQTEQGQQLKRRDDLQQVRGFVRAQNLDTRSNCGYNILTGDNRKGVEDVVPSELRQDYSQKVQEKDNYYNIKHYALQQQLLKY